MGRVRRLLRRFKSGALILCYHRVTNLGSDPQLLSVTPQHFAEHLEVLRGCSRISRLQDWQSDRYRSRPFGRRAVVITFDDGYADNFWEALPLLQAAECPATIFVTAGKLDDDREFWWDELERVFLTSQRLPDELSLQIGSHRYIWRIDPLTGQEGDVLHWDVSLKREPTLRQVAYLELGKLLRRQDELERARILEDLCLWAGLQRAGRLSHRPLKTSELCALASDPLIEIGAHTVSHPSLGCVAPSVQHLEIEKSKSLLQDVAGRPVCSFSYPFGGRGDYNADTIALVRKAGFHLACANFPDLLDSQTNPYEMPRFLVRDWDGDQFANLLRNWALL
jgi:peptidoglycan/xylan/chitin deacetylase (PgdA/CDA1 family)